jgi:hypothetical protein
MSICTHMVCVMVCVCRVAVRVYEQILQLYQMRGFKKKKQKSILSYNRLRQSQVNPKRENGPNITRRPNNTIPPKSMPL